LYFTGSGLKYLDLYDLDPLKLPLIPKDASSLP